MKKKILFIDMDGTIIHGDELLCSKDVTKIKELQEAGHLVAFNTGRNFSEVQVPLNAFGLSYDYLVLSNGGYLYSKEEGPLYHYTMDQKAAFDILLKAMELDITTYFFDGTNTYCYEQGKSYIDNTGGRTLLEDFDYLGTFQGLSGVELISFHQMDQQIERLMVLKEYIDTNHRDSVTGHVNLHYLDVCAPGCDKGKGVTYLKEKLDVETYCIGDSYNDIPMFEVADHAFTFQCVDKDIQMHTQSQVDYVWQVVDKMLGGS